MSPPKTYVSIPSKLQDVTISVDGMKEGSLILIIGIPTFSFVACYFVRKLAEERQRERDFQIQMRTLAAVEDALGVDVQQVVL